MVDVPGWELSSSAGRHGFVSARLAGATGDRRDAVYAALRALGPERLDSIPLAVAHVAQLISLGALPFPAGWLTAGGWPVLWSRAAARSADTRKVTLHHAR